MKKAVENAGSGLRNTFHNIVNLKELKVKDKIMFFILPIMVAGFSLIIYFGYTMTAQNFMREYENNKEQVSMQVGNTVNLVDAGFRMLEKNMEQEMERVIIQFRKEFEKAGGNPDKVDLEKLKHTIGSKYDLVIIDDKTTIIKATLEKGLNFNFIKFDPKVGEEINKIRLADVIRHERLRTNVGTGFLSKFSYIPTKDHKYLLELVYEQGEPNSIVQEMDPLKITAKLIKTNDIVSMIRIFDVFGYEFVNSGKNYKPTKESLAIVQKTKINKSYEIVNGNIEKKYIFIDLNAASSTMTDNSKIIEIVFDKTIMINQTKKIAYVTFMMGLFIIALTMLIIIYLSKKITQPITLLATAAKRVAKGDYDTVADKISNDEIGDLSEIFNTMTEKIKQNFEKIEIQRNELEDYSRNLEKKVLERTAELKEEQGILKATLLSIGDGVVSTDKYGMVQIVNAVAESLTGWTQEQAYGKPFVDIFNIINENDGLKGDNPIELVLKTGELVDMEIPGILVDKNGYRRPVENIAAPIRDENGAISGAVLAFRDYSEKKEKIERIEYLSLHDQLTGLYNRRFLEEELKRLDNSRNLPLTMAMLDVNGLKLINDAFGHMMGDIVLQRAASIMKNECRADDIIARIGGDEFVILLPATSMIEAEAILKRINTVMENYDNVTINMSVSYGVATKKKMSEKVADIFKLAEDHMYRRKLSESKSMHYRTIEIIMKTLHEKSEREKKHSERVSKLCECIGNAMNLKQEDIKDLITTGLMHDIGKIAIDLSILDKPDKLTVEERAEIERHPEQGYQILRSINEFAKLAEYVLAHHERWDGTGYPSMLAGEEIPVIARIIAVADAYDAMTCDRAYRKALSREAAIKELEVNSGTQFDPAIVRIFVDNDLANF